MVVLALERFIHDCHRPVLTLTSSKEIHTLCSNLFCGHKLCKKHHEIIILTPLKPLLKIQSKMTVTPEDISRNRELKYSLFVLVYGAGLRFFSKHNNNNNNNNNNIKTINGVTGQTFR